MAQEQSKLPIHSDEATQDVAPGRRDWPTFADIRRDMDSMFEDFTRDLFRFPSRFRMRNLGEMPQLQSRLGLQPSVDVVEAENAYRITVELPGMDQKAVDVRMSGDMLTIKGEKTEIREKDDRGAHISERRYGSFERSFTLPAGVDRDRIEAAMSNGVLTLTLPKTAEAKAKEKKIDVKSS